MSTKIVIGIDVGGSSTKIVGFYVDNDDLKLIDPLVVRANDPIASIYGAFGKFTTINAIKLSDITKVLITGVGSSYLQEDIYGLPCEVVPEFSCVGFGGLYVSGLDRAIIGSLGTGTAYVYADKVSTPKYLGGTGVGGGTLMGLSKTIIHTTEIPKIEELAKDGDLSKIDLKINDISKNDIISGFGDKMTASNFGRTADLATPSDFALGIINLVFETIGMIGVFAARNHNTKDIVLTGYLASIEQAKPIIDNMSKMFNVNFIIPKLSQYSTAIGAALHYIHK